MPSRATARLRLHGWRHPTVIAVALLGVAAGFAQYAPTASLQDVAVTFGANGSAEEVGLTTTTVGLGLAVIRLASLGALPIASVADRVGRRRVLLGCIATGLLLTATAAAAPTFWWFVLVVAVSRPLFSATTAVGSVVVSEETRSVDRAKAVALAAAGYGIGTGLVTVARVPLNDLFGASFRGVFAVAVVFLLALPLLAPLLGEPDRFVVLRERRRSAVARPKITALTSVHPRLRGRLLLLTLVTFTFNGVTGPHNTYVFFYGEGDLGISDATMAVVIVVSGALGLGGLLFGRWCTDRFGRRPSIIAFHLVMAASVVLAYSGTVPALMAGLWVGVTAQGAYGPAFGALSTEVFPTSVRATTQGWVAAAGVLGAVAGLLLFGRIDDVSGSFAPAAVAVATIAAISAIGYRFFPETVGMELEDSAPEPDESDATAAEPSG